MNRELAHLKDWEHMMFFAIALIDQSKLHKGSGIWGERIIILHLDHANELLMKSFLVKKGFIVSYLEKNKLGDGVKEEDFLNKSKTIEYGDCLKIVCKNISPNTFNEEKQKKILKFHKIRNEIQHRAININQNKKTEIELFYPYFKELHSLMFPEYSDVFPDFIED